MSFETGGVPNYNPKVQSTFFNKNGGGGNTGYFQQRQQEEAQPEEPNEDIIQLTSTKAEDKESMQDVDISLKDFKLIYQIVSYIRKAFKSFLLKNFGNTKDVDNEDSFDTFLKTEIK